MTITDEALRLVIGEYTREAGVRNLERQIGTIARKIAARVATGAAAGRHRVVEADELESYLGPARFKQEIAFRTSRPGRRHRRRVDRDRRRRAVHRSQPAARRPRHSSSSPDSSAR